MHDRARRFRLGLFVLAAGALFLLLLAFILENTFTSERATYYIMFEDNVKGMVVGSKVNFQGVPVGVVCDMRFQDGKTLVELRIDPTRASIQDVTKARMDRLLVTGQVTIELEGYDETGKPLPAGSIIEPKTDPLSSLRGSIPEVVAQATSVLARLDRLLERAENVLGDENQAHATEILGNLASASAHLTERTLPEVDAALADVRRLAGDGGELTRDAAAALGRLEPRLAALADGAESLAREARAFTGAIRAPTQTALASMRAALEDVRALARQLKLAPDSLLFGVSRRAAAPGGRE